MGYLKKIGTSIIYIATFLAGITYMPGLQPNIETEPYQFKSPVALKEQNNGRLNGAERLFEGEIKGPESFDSFDGILYTSLHGGTVAKLVNNKLVKVVKFGQKCDGLYDEETCGRPLGVKFDKQGNLFVVDAYYGIFKVNVKKGSYENIVYIKKPIDGKLPMLPNSIDVASNGDLYWTDSSTDFKLQDGIFIMLANPSGRLLRYNAATRKTEVLLKNLACANGVHLSADESFLLVSDLMRSRILKYHLKGPKSGKSEVFLEALPGLPDNIHVDGLGNFLIALPIVADEEHPLLTQSLAQHPSLRKMIMRFLAFLETPFRILELYLPNHFSKVALHYIGHFESVGLFMETPSIVLRVDPNGKILDVLDVTDGSGALFSSAFPHGDYLYLGSYANNYLARIPLEKVLPDVKKAMRKEERVESVPTPATPKMTPTTPRPTPKITMTSRPTTTTTTTPKPTTTRTTTPKPTTTATTTPKPTTTPRPTTTTTTTSKPTTTTTTTTPRPTTTTPKPTTTTPKPPTTTETPKKINQNQGQRNPDVRPVREKSERKFVKDEM